MSREMGLLVQDAGWTMEDLRWVTINAMKSAFIPFDERLAIIEDVVKPGYADLAAEVQGLTGLASAVERVGRQQPLAAVVLAGQAFGIPPSPVGDDGGEDVLGMDAGRRWRRDVRQDRTQRLMDKLVA